MMKINTKIMLKQNEKMNESSKKQNSHRLGLLGNDNDVPIGGAAFVSLGLVVTADMHSVERMSDCNTERRDFNNGSGAGSSVNSETTDCTVDDVTADDDANNGVFRITFPRLML